MIDDMGFTFLLEVLQSLVLFGTLGAGFLVLLFLMLDNCRHTLVMVVIVTTGLVHELYCASVLGYFKRLMQIESLRPEDDGCRDFSVPTLIANAMIITTVTKCVISAAAVRKKRLMYNTVMLHALLSVSLLIWQNPEKSRHQTPSMNLTTNVQVYFTICRNDVVGGVMYIVMEYILYYLPLAILYIWIAKINCTSDTGMKAYIK